MRSTDLMIFFISTIVVYSVVIPLIAGLYRFKKLSGASKTLFYFIVASGICDVVLAILTNRHVDSRPGAHFYTVAELLFLSFFFYRALKFKSKQTIIGTIAIGFVALSVINTLYFQPLHQFNTYTRSLEALIMIVYSFVYFNQESLVRQSARWEKKPLNWYFTGLLIYFAGALFFFLFSNVVSKLTLPTQLFLWCLHGTMQIIMYILITAGFLRESGRS